MKTWHIHIEGRVQGVGFRPFVYGLAKKKGLNGTVANTLEGVHIFVNSDDGAVEKLIREIRENTPARALITSIDFHETELRDFDGFRIIESDVTGNPDLLITPDFAICDECRQELNDPANRRYRYPFITCTVCGPRFSIESGLPYDRARTSMKDFEMCPACEREYNDPLDRRFYSQTNSCPDCRISQWVVDNHGNVLDLKEEEIVDFVCEKIREGSIIAVKGIGGFLLMCDASNIEKVDELRHKKDRPAKPFALMYPDIEMIKDNFMVCANELAELQSAASPIVLLKLKDGAESSNLTPHMAPRLNRLGVMLPYTPLFVLIAEKLHMPLLATSGNFKGSPITYRNEDAINSLSKFADYFLMNNRDIQIPQDDSVVRFSNNHHRKIMMRRSRGYAPGYLQQAIDESFDEKVLAMGPSLKTTFGIWQEGRCHISQYLGDTAELDSQISYERTLKHFQKLLNFSPDVVLIDKHPAYFTSQLGRDIAAGHDAEIIDIQHHEAHFWSVIGENNLLDTKEKLLGVVFDGTGMGRDGAVCGGEFFTYSNGMITRRYHIEYYTHILGDKMAREPRLSALSLLHFTHGDVELVERLFTAYEMDFYMKVLDQSTLKTSSMGRLFDGVSSLLGLRQVNTYEGEAAIYLEGKAREYCNKEAYPPPYDFKLNGDGTIDFTKIITGIISDLHNDIDIRKIAARFHYTVVMMIKAVADDYGAGALAFSGGVFQNSLLIDMILDELGDKFNLYFHKELSPNDEGISYGQLVGYYASKKYGKNS